MQILLHIPICRDLDVPGRECRSPCHALRPMELERSMGPYETFQAMWVDLSFFSETTSPCTLLFDPRQWYPLPSDRATECPLERGR